MPIILSNNRSSITIDKGVNYKYNLDKGSFDAVLYDAEGGSPLVHIILRSQSIRGPIEQLDWREISSPTVTSAQELLDLILTWNVPPSIITDENGNVIELVENEYTSKYQIPILLEGIEDRLSVNDSSQLKSTLHDSDGNEIASHLMGDGDHHLGVVASIIGEQNPERHAWITPSNELLTESAVRLVGTNFDGTNKDPNFYAETVTGSGSVSQDGEIEIATGTTANSTAKYATILYARFVVSSALKLQTQVKFVTESTVDNVRRIGAYDADDGFFFQLDGSVFSVGWRNGGSDTLVNSGSFNGNYGLTFTPLNTEYYKLEIEWGPKGVFFYVNGTLLHKNGQGHLTGKLSLPATFENINDNGQDTNVIMDVLAIAITRLGDLITQPISKFISTNTTTICKYGVGVLQRIINVDNAGTVTVYDNTAASGTVLATIDSSKALGTLQFNIPFSIGLTIVTATGAKIVVVYE